MLLKARHWLGWALIVALVMASCALSAPLRADEPATPRAPEARALLARLNQRTAGRVRVSYHSGTGAVRFIGADATHPIPLPDGLDAPRNPVEAALAFLREYGYLFGLDNPDEQLAVMAQKLADRGRSIVRFQQMRGGVPVLGGELNVQLSALWQVLAANGEIIPHLALSATPAVTPELARERALALVGKHYSLPVEALTAAQPALWFYDPALLGAPGAQLTRLVWRLEVTAGSPVAIRELVLIDALSGMTALHFSQLDTARERSIYDNANNAALGLPGYGPVRSEGGGATGIADVDAAYDYLGDTYDFYASYHGRDSLDNAGMALVATVRYCPSADECPYDNAFWNGQQMVFGEGFAAADDVVAHELTHGVTDYESRLFYYMQSGAINEAFSDIWGEYVDLTNGAGNDSPSVRWLMGEDIGAFRNMKDPSQFSHPARMTDERYRCGAWSDGGGVHTNSGVANKAAYLITDGDTFNGYTVRGLGIGKAARIWYEVQTNLLTSASDYEDLYDALIQAAVNLVGAHGITLDDAQQVRYAVDATEMNQQPISCPAKEAPQCEYEVASTLFFDDCENTASGNWSSAATIGSNEWYYPPRANPYGYDATYAVSGEYNLWGYGQPARGDYYIAMTHAVAIPPNAYLHFAHAYEFEYTTYFGTRYDDGGVIEYSAGGGAWQDAGSLITDNGYQGTISSSYSNPLGGRSAFVGASNGYISSRLDLGALAGRNVRFRYRIGTDTSGDGLGWFIDDVRIYTCAGAPIGAIQIVPNRADAPWSLTGAGSTSGVGGRTENEAPIGEYTITWGDLNGCTTPVSATQTLTAGGVITFTGEYACAGQIVVTSNRPDAPWTLSGPANYAGVGDQVISSAPVGDYVISWSAPADCAAPVNEARSLDRGGQIAFSGVYACSAWPVTSAADSGPGTLRWALSEASAGDTITFDPATFAPASPVTISLASALPNITQGGLTLDAANAGVVLDGAALGAGQGLTLDSNDNTVRNLTIVRFPDSGVRITGSGNTIEGCTLTGNHGDGVRVYGSTALSNRLTRNAITTNGGAGIALLSGGNGALAAPTITDMNPWTGLVKGASGANHTIEVFADSADEGRTYLGATTANASGAWSLTTGAQIEGPYVTATAADAAGNTSAFSTPFQATLTAPPLWIANFSTTAGGWTTYDLYPRQLGDVNGDGRADIVGFGNKATYVSLSTGSGFATATPWIRNYGPSVGGWTSQNTYPRMLGDVNGDGRADIVAFGNKATYVSLSTGSKFSAQVAWIGKYGVSAGGWTSQDLYPRQVGDVNGDGRADVVGFGNKATYVSLSTGSSFGPAQEWLRAYGASAGGWTSQDIHPRLLADVNGDGRADVVAFGNGGVYVSLSTGASFGASTLWVGNYGKSAGGWSSYDVFPRQAADVNGDGRADVIGFGNAATYYSLSTGASFGAARQWVQQFGVTAGGWSDYDTFPRQVADVTGGGKADIVGFGDGGVYVWESNK